jgi:hypothetical protein
LEAKLRVGYFDNWCGEGPYILFSGNMEVIQKLEEVFYDLSKSKITEINIEQLEFVEIHHGLKIKACVAQKTPGFLKMFGISYSLGLREYGEKNSFIWDLQDWEWDNNAGLISDFEGEMPSHQYLNVFNSGTTGVVVSKNEYSDEWWEKFG